MFQYTHALVRGLPKQSFAECLKLSPPKHPIDLDLAESQHDQYVSVMESILQAKNIMNIKADLSYPDCCFIEDTCVITEGIALVNHMGAPSRRGEVNGVKAALEQLKSQHVLSDIVVMQSPATLDGGDVLTMEKEILVGLSKRTNSEGVEWLTKTFTKHRVLSFQVEEGLHFKSIMSALDEKTIVIVDNEQGRRISKEINNKSDVKYDFLFVPDAAASNLIRVQNYVLVQFGFPESIKILEPEITKRNLQMKLVNTNELEKADGLLTCCSVLIKSI